jgi:flagellar biosynthetic protein FlhB
MADNRTEKPTKKRRDDARRKGQIARRPELAAVAGFLSTVLMMQTVGLDWAARSSVLFHDTARFIHDLKIHEELTPLTVERMIVKAVGEIMMLSLPLVAAALTAGIAASLAQGGLTFSPEALSLKMERFSPVSNFRRVFSLDTVVELLKSILKISGVAIVCYDVIMQSMDEAPRLTGAPAAEVMKAVGMLLYGTGWRAGLTLLVIAALDYGYGWYRHEQSLKMTRQEVRDEHRQQEGDPAVRAQRRRAARLLLQRQIAAEVPRSDVVVTNPTHFAVALRYDSEKHAAPVITAKGADEMARRIREIARASNVPVVENPPLARGLYRSVEVGRAIPPEFFRAVAELLAWIYRQREDQ